MPAQLDHYTIDLMNEIAPTDRTLRACGDKITLQQAMIYLFNKAHTQELIETKDDTNRRSNAETEHQSRN